MKFYTFGDNNAPEILLLPGTEDIPFVQSWPQVLKKRGRATLVWLMGAAVVAVLVIWIF